MNIKKIQRYKSIFDSIVNIIKDDDEQDVEVWYARDLQKLLGYIRWENFAVAIGRAIESCKSVGVNIDDHFREIKKIVSLGSSSQREVQDLMLTRYACYLIAQNGDPKKEEIAFAQSYFAVQTRKVELIEERLNQLSRIEKRERLRMSEKQLSKIIYQRGVDDKGFGRIRSKGDQALSPGIFIPKGMPIGEVVSGSHVLHAYAQDNQIGHLSEGQIATVRVKDSLETWKAKIVSVNKVPARLTLSPLIQFFGGPIPAYAPETGSKEYQSILPLYSVELAFLDDNLALPDFGRVASVTFTHSARLYDKVRQFAIAAFRKEM